jgi:hypothetical protein
MFAPFVALSIVVLFGILLPFRMLLGEFVRSVGKSTERAKGVFSHTNWGQIVS